MNKKELNLYKVYTSQSKPKQKSLLLNSLYTPLIICLFAGLVVWAIFLRINLSLSLKNDKLENWLSNPTNITQYEKAEALEKEVADIRNDVTAVQNLNEALGTYPLITSKLIDKIAAVGGKDIKMEITGYNASTGALKFDAISYEVIDIPDYILKLKQTGLFNSVDYTGYGYNAGCYKLSLKCTMCADAGREVASK